MDKISQKYESYENIKTEFGGDRIQERIQDFFVAYRNYIAVMEEKLNCKNRIRINEKSLTHAVMDYFTDIYRLKQFHEIERANKFKILSYELNWILRRKPLQIVAPEPGTPVDPQVEEELVFINERFVLARMVSFMEEWIGFDFYKEANEYNRRCLDGYIDSLDYYLKYRECNAQVLELALLSFAAGIAASNIKVGPVNETN